MNSVNYLPSRMNHVNIGLLLGVMQLVIYSNIRGVAFTPLSFVMRLEESGIHMITSSVPFLVGS